MPVHVAVGVMHLTRHAFGTWLGVFGESSERPELLELTCPELD